MRIKRLCSISSCKKPHFGHGLCSTHYARNRKYGTTYLPTKIRQAVLLCVVNECSNYRLAKGLCQKHYYRQRQHGRLNVPTLLDRFWNNVQKTNHCWLWIGNKDKDGYGNIGNGPRNNYKAIRAHRLSYELHIEQIPEELLVCHKCDNPSCVNPEHLFIGTHQDNENDKKRKGRQAKGQRNGNSHTARMLRLKKETL